MRGRMNAILAPGICLMALCLFGSTAVLGADLEMELSCLPPSPGTGTPGYWGNHPEAWPVDCIEIGGIPFPKDVAIQLMMAPVKGDKTLTLFPALVAAKLNVAIGNDDSCIACTITMADAWMAQYPVGSGVKANSDPWDCAEPLYCKLDAYNNGCLCAPSRDAMEMELSCLPPSPGTGTPGYWGNHPEAWPVDCIEIGGIPFPKDVAIQLMMAPVKGDKTLTLFPALVAAKLNVAIGNDDSCIAYTITMADAWMAQYPVGSGVKANSDPWDCAEPLYCKLDAYNNGYLCAPSRDAMEMELSCLPPSPGTGTPGYWGNHPEAWPVDCIEIGGIPFPKDVAIQLMMAPVKGDKTLTLFPALVAAKLNVAIGNDDSCIACTITMADAWMAQYPVGSGVKANSDPWDCAEPLYCKLDAYNNGCLCAPSRDALE